MNSNSMPRRLLFLGDSIFERYIDGMYEREEIWWCDGCDCYHVRASLGNVQ